MFQIYKKEETGTYFVGYVCDEGVYLLIEERITKDSPFRTVIKQSLLPHPYVATLVEGKVVRRPVKQFTHIDSAEQWIENEGEMLMNVFTELIGAVVHLVEK